MKLSYTSRTANFCINNLCPLHRAMELNRSQKASLEVYYQKQHDLLNDTELPEYTTSFNRKHPFTDYYRPIRTVYDNDIAYKKVYR